MKILHTADWHAGRVLHGQPRTPEIREVLREVAELAKTEAVDLVLVAGDLYDTRNPGAEAETAVYEFFKTLGDASIPSVVIAGNHDAPGRLEAASGLLGLAGVRIVGEPKVAQQGGLLTLNLGGETARVAALPFVSERRIVKVQELLGGDPGAWRESYREGMRKLINNLTAPFRPDAVNLLLLHTTTDGARLAHSEYEFHCTENYTLDADLFPEACNYVALGHIHMPQRVEGLPENAGRYAGSILQLDFGEQGDAKYVYVLEARAGRPTEIVKEHALRAGKRLKRVSLAREDLDRNLSELEWDGWLKLSIKLERPDPGLKDRLKRDYPNLLVVEQLLPEREGAAKRGVDQHTLSLVDAYAQFYDDERAAALPDDLRGAFNTLYAEAQPLADEPEFTQEFNEAV
ncbi:MAG: SbcD_Mre11 [uncultured Truepera sp.]|uniref:Nuclease SbcCD subunit D n=1 Tax=uncultured Truepera sp. TaxID=543023 RepID=A0A6J4VRR8_9DEIN|nr:MAG: SbcD_Mre11 [uncultured Truepera sp.]